MWGADHRRMAPLGGTLMPTLALASRHALQRGRDRETEREISIVRMECAILASTIAPNHPYDSMGVQGYLAHKKTPHPRTLE